MLITFLWIIVTWNIPNILLLNSFVTFIILFYCDVKHSLNFIAYCYYCYIANFVCLLHNYYYVPLLLFFCISFFFVFVWSMIYTRNFRKTFKILLRCLTFRKANDILPLKKTYIFFALLNLKIIDAVANTINRTKISIYIDKTTPVTKSKFVQILSVCL